MNYADRKAALGIRPTAIDTGFSPDFGFSKYEEPEYLPGKVRDRSKARAPAGEDLSHLNSPDSPDFRSRQHFKRRHGSGRKARK